MNLQAQQCKPYTPNTASWDNATQSDMHVIGVPGEGIGEEEEMGKY